MSQSCSFYDGNASPFTSQNQGKDQQTMGELMAMMIQVLVLYDLLGIYTTSVNLGFNKSKPIYSHKVTCYRKTTNYQLLQPYKKIVLHKSFKQKNSEIHPQNQELLLSSILFKQQRIQLATTKTTGHHIELHKQTAIEYNGNRP